MSETGLKRMFQIGIVVSDAMKAAENFCELARIDKNAIQFIDTGASGNAMPTLYVDKTVTTYNKLAMVMVAGVEFEFIEYSGADPNFNADYFKEHGACVSHICCDFGDYDASTAAMLAMGGKMVSDGGQGDFRYNYIDMRESMGLVFENYADGLKKMKMGL